MLFGLRWRLSSEIAEVSLTCDFWFFAAEGEFCGSSARKICAQDNLCSVGLVGIFFMAAMRDVRFALSFAVKVFR